ncbi:MAG: DUF6898 family protein [Bdellovibrionales bacterium]
MLDDREIIFEFFPVGTYIKVTAMDTKSLTEVSIQGPAGTPEKILQNNALRRLKYVMEKKGVI